MLTHEDIWRAIDRLAELNGYSPSGLAKKGGLDPTSFNKSKRFSRDGKPRWPSTESLSKVLGVTDSTLSDLLSLIGQNDLDAPPYDRAKIAAQTAEILIDTKSILFNAAEPFTLKSGRLSPVYFDGRRLISFVKEREILMDFAARVIEREIGDDIDYVAGGETAGIPYGAMIAERLKKPMVYVRKEPKGYGRMAQIEGVLPPRKKVRTLLVEDMQTDGGSKKVFVEALRKAGAIVDHAFVMFHYGIFPASEKNMKSLGITLHALCTWWDVLKVARGKKYFDELTLKEVEKFLHNPESWTRPS